MIDDNTSYLLLQKRREEYSNLKQALFSEYMQLQPQFKEQNLFFCMNGCQEARPSHRHPQGVFSAKELKSLFSDSRSTTHNGGYFLRWNQKGICINPSEGFLQRFCEFGHHLWEIDLLIVTSSASDASAELELIHQLNRELNQLLLSYEQEPHVIKYLLHPAVLSRHASKLRPLFREEKGTVVCLEAFQQEKEELLPLDDQLSLSYANARLNTGSEALMIRLHMPHRQFGFLTDAAWDDSCRHFFRDCDLLLVGFGKTTPEDLAGLDTSLSTIGYRGIVRCAKELAKIQLLLVSEFDESLGDIRLEVIKKLKAEKNIAALPLDLGFVMDLDTLAIKTDTHTLPPYHFTPYQDVRVVRTRELFSQLLFLSKEEILE